MRALIRAALERTAGLWPDIAETHRWLHAAALHAAAYVLANAAGLPAAKVQGRYDRPTAAGTGRRDRAGVLAPAVDHFMKVTASYRPGLFHCCTVADLPRTDNDLEHLFGAHRHHERRATGRKVASPSLVLRGSVRIVAATATRIAPFSANDLTVGFPKWPEVRKAIEVRRQARVLRTRFRRNQEAYLADLQTRACQQALPA